MKLILIFFFSLFLYISCANGTKSEVVVLNKIKSAKQETFGWDNSENRKQLISAIKNADLEGLISSDYNYNKLIIFENAYLKLSSKEIENYYSLLTSSFTKYVSHLTNGKLNPRELYPDWDVKRKEVKADSFLNIALYSNAMKATLDYYKPKHTIYNSLKKSLYILKSLPKDNFKPISTKVVFNLGDQDKIIINIKRRLQYWNDLSKLDSLSSLYDEKMHDAIKNFQSRHGLQPDGVIGIGTILALNVSKEIRKQQVIVNLERWRWFPKNFGTNYLAVNIPNYYLHAVQNIDTTRIFRVVVGTEKRKTPILSSKIDNVVFNPTWTVPPTIMKEDLIPGVQKNKDYLTARNITIYNRKGKEVNLGDWHYNQAEDYKYVQKPGEDNALGFVKINFPNNHMVYLHDTNHRDYFVKNYRALSSGCIRVEDPLQLAEYILYNKPENYNATTIDSIITFKKTTTINLEEEIEVHILYFTAWYEDNNMQFRDDIYGYDPELYLRLSNQFRSNVVAPVGVVNK